MQTRTSTSHPLRVDFLPLGLPGRVGLTLAPGKKSVSTYNPWRWDRDVGQDLDRLIADYAPALLVSLIEDVELPRYQIEHLYTEAAARGLRVLRFPIRDVDVPPSVEGVAPLVDDILAEAGAGRTVVIHCVGGLGRTGTIGGCVACAAGHTPDEAFRMLRDARGPNCPETQAQRRFVERFAASLG